MLGAPQSLSSLVYLLMFFFNLWNDVHVPPTTCFNFFDFSWLTCEAMCSEPVEDMTEETRNHLL
jgi:hypothetical protein